MKYNSTLISDPLSIEGIVTVLRHTFSVVREPYVGESHDFPELLYVVKGRQKQLVDGTEYTVEAGQMMIYAPRAYHIARQTSGAQAYILSFRVATDAILPLCHQVFSLSPYQRQMLQQICEEGLAYFTKCGPAEKKQGIKGMMVKKDVQVQDLQRMKKQLELFLLGLLVPPDTVGGKGAKWQRDFERAEQYMLGHIGEPLTLMQIADGCGISVSKLKLVFREKSGGGPIQYFINMKIERAKRLIAEDSLNFSEIASLLGFDSLHYFSRCFKKATGLSPSQYKKTK